MFRNIFRIRFFFSFWSTNLVRYTFLATGRFKEEYRLTFRSKGFDHLLLQTLRNLSVECNVVIDYTWKGVLTNWTRWSIVNKDLEDQIMKETDMLSYALCLQYSCVYNSRVFVINNDFKEIILSTWMENHKRLSGRQVRTQRKRFRLKNIQTANRFQSLVNRRIVF